MRNDRLIPIKALPFDRKTLSRRRDAGLLPPVRGSGRNKGYTENDIESMQHLLDRGMDNLAFSASSRGRGRPRLADYAAAAGCRGRK